MEHSHSQFDWSRAPSCKHQYENLSKVYWQTGPGHWIRVRLTALLDTHWTYRLQRNHFVASSKFSLGNFPILHNLLVISVLSTKLKIKNSATAIFSYLKHFFELIFGWFCVDLIVWIFARIKNGHFRPVSLSNNKSGQTWSLLSLYIPPLYYSMAPGLQVRLYEILIFQKDKLQTDF